MKKLFTRLNNWFNRTVTWRMYGLFSAQRFLLLRTEGRKTGKRRTVILTYLQENAAFLVVASNGGQALMPAWYRNLRASPQAEIQVGRKRFQVDAELVPSAEHEQRWAVWLKQHPAYENAQKKTARQFPLLWLTPREKNVTLF